MVESGFIENKTFKETRFITQPTETYVVYLDTYSARGADNRNMLREHGITIELYSYKADPTAEERIETILDKYGIEYEKDPRYWLEKDNVYQVLYTFNYIEK